MRSDELKKSVFDLREHSCFVTDRDDVRLIFTTIILEVPEDISARE
jgi:hypothetical protein